MTNGSSSVESPETTASASCVATARREHFIPLRKADLVALLSRESDGSAEAVEQFHQLCRLLERRLHHEFHAQLEELKENYAPFDPDADTKPLEHLTDEEHETRAASLFERFTWLLERANFRRLDREGIQSAVGAMGHWGLHLEVDFDAFQQLEVFVRGAGLDHRIRRRLRHLYRKETIDVPLHRRLVIIFRPTVDLDGDGKPDGDAIFIKIFKNIPCRALDMILPGTRVRMTLLDQGKILVPTFAGLSMTLAKLLQGAVLVAAAGLSSLIAYLGLAAGAIGYGTRSFYGYVRTKEKYQLSLTRSLYYQNLDNNAGVLFRLLDEAEEQEFREALLGYFFLWRSAGPEGWTEPELDRHVEEFLRHTLQMDVDFEIGDVLVKLRRFALVEPAGEGRLRARPIDKVLATLDETWQDTAS